MEWEATTALRLVPVRHRNPLTGGWYPPVLQQQWRKPVLNALGHLSDFETEWRNVPIDETAALNANG